MVNRRFPWPRSGDRRRIPLGVMLTVPFALLLSGAVGLTGWLSIRNGRENVEQLEIALSEQINARIQTHLHDYLDAPYVLMDAFAATIDSGAIDVDDDIALQNFFWHQIQQTSPGSTVLYGDRQAAVVGIHHQSEGDYLLLRQNEATEFRWNVYELDDVGQPSQLLKSSDRPEQRFRPWYLAAERAQQPMWSPIFPAQSVSGSVVTAAQPVFDARGELKGVLGFTITLSQISNFLRELAISSSGRAFVVEPSGDLVASSSPRSPFISAEDDTTRGSAIAHSDPAIQAASRFLLQQFGSFERIDAASQQWFPWNGQRHLVEVTPFRDDRGLEWLVVLVIPESDFAADIQANTRRTMVLCGIALAIA
ncbi:MAG: cache domain-containing protein, partial [Cyanobacteria bacterium J06639_1]